jgi:hypothetical protein
MFIKSFIFGCISLATVAGTAFATGNHEYKEKDFKPCQLEVTDSPQIHNKHCKPKTTPEVTPTPVITPKPTRTPKATPTPAATPVVTPAVTPSITTTTKTVSQPAALPSVGADGR